MLFSPVYIASDLRPLVSLRSTSPVFLLTDHSPLITAHYCFKSFSCNTYGSPCKCCKQKTYGQAKPFRCNTYKKQGGREGVPSSTFRGPSNSHLRSRRAPPGEPVRVTYGVRVSRGARWNDLTSSFRRHQSPPTLFLCSQLSTVNSRLSSL